MAPTRWDVSDRAGVLSWQHKFHRMGSELYYSPESGHLGGNLEVFKSYGQEPLWVGRLLAGFLRRVSPGS